MSKKWTREERRKYHTQKFYTLREKIFVILFVVIIFITIICALNYAIQTGNIGLIVALVVALIIFAPIAIFIIDIFHWEFG